MHQGIQKGRNGVETKIGLNQTFKNVVIFKKKISLANLISCYNRDKTAHGDHKSNSKKVGSIPMEPNKNIKGQLIT